MIHILSHQSDEIIGWIPSVLDDVHSHGLDNNEETYEFTVHVTERDSDKLTSRARLLIPSEDGDFRELIIDFTEEQTYNMTKRVIAYGSFVDLRKLKVIAPQSITGQSVRTAANYVLADLPWEVGITDYSSIRTWTIDNHTDAYSALMALATLFDKEIRFRVTTDGDTVTGRYVDFIDRQGLDNGKEIVFGKDLEGVTRRVLADRLVTALHCIGPEREDGTRLEVVVEDDNAYQNWNWFGNHLVQVYEPQSEDQDMTLERLTQLGQTELAKRISAAIEYEVTAFSLEQIFGYEHERVRLGDSARIKDEHFNPPMYLDSRIVYVERSVFDLTEKSFKLGEVIEYTEEEVMATWRELQAKYAPKIVRSDTPPFGRANTIWIDTSQVPNVAHTWNGTTWVKATPTVAGEVGAETPEGAQDKADAAEAGAKSYADTLKAAIDQDIADVVKDVTDLNGYVDGAFEDSIISQAEAKAIEKYLNSLNAEKIDLDNRYNQVYGNASLTGTPKTNLASAKGTYNTAHTNLINSINTAIADGQTTATEKTDVDSKFTSYRTALATLSQRFEEAINNIAQNKANAAESGAKTYADGLKTVIDGEISDIRGDLSALDTYVDGAFADGIVSQAEAKAIEKYLNALGAEKSDLDTKYSEIYNNASLTGTPKSNLLSAKNAYNTSHSNLVGSINTAIADGKASATEKADVDTKFTDYRAKLATLAQRFEQSIDAIAQAKATAAETAAKSHADSKANTAEANAKLYAQNASNITSGIIDVGAVPLRTAPSGARIVFDGTNGFVQYNAQGQAIVQLGLNGVNKFAGELQAATGTFNGTVRVSGTNSFVEIAQGAVYSEYNNGTIKKAADLSDGALSLSHTTISSGITEGGSLEVNAVDGTVLSGYGNVKVKSTTGDVTLDAGDDIFLNAMDVTIDATSLIRFHTDGIVRAQITDDGINLPGTSDYITTSSRAWIAPTLLNGVSNYGGGYQTAAYYKDAMGFVHLRGFLTGSADGKHIFTLPAGYRPSALSNFTTWSNSSVGTSRIAISTTGVVTATVSGNWLALEGISFMFGN